MTKLEKGLFWLIIAIAFIGSQGPRISQAITQAIKDHPPLRAECSPVPVPSATIPELFLSLSIGPDPDPSLHGRPGRVLVRVSCIDRPEGSAAYDLRLGEQMSIALPEALTNGSCVISVEATE